MWPKGKKKGDNSHQGNANKNHRYFFIPTRRAVRQTSKCWQECEELGTLNHCWREGKIVKPLWKTVQQILKIINTTPYNSNSTLAIYLPKRGESKTATQKRIHTDTHTHTRVVTAKTCEQLRRPSTDLDKQIQSKLTMEYYWQQEEGSTDP